MLTRRSHGQRKVRDIRAVSHFGGERQLGHVLQFATVVADVIPLTCMPFLQAAHNITRSLTDF